MSVPGLFVVGTDTGVGKTFVSAMIARALQAEGRRVGVLKPVATGAVRSPDGFLRSDDAERLNEAIGGDYPLERIVPLVYEEPIAPCLAARRSGTRLTQPMVEATTGDALDWWGARSEVMIVEGTGGLLSPLAEGTTVADLAVWLDFPLVIVGRRKLGALNHMLLTVEAARFRSIRVAGLILDSPEPANYDLAEMTCADELARRLPRLALLAELHHIKGTDMDAAIGSLDWSQLAKPSRVGRQDDQPVRRPTNYVL